MRKRTQSREYALKILYQAELTRREIHFAAETFWKEFESIDENVRSFSDRITAGVEENLKTIDASRPNAIQKAGGTTDAIG